MSDRLPSLDGIRAACIALVVGAHAAHGGGFPPEWAPAARYLFSGELGVRAFFVLSGFLITYLLAAEEERAGRVSLRGFYARRAVRILPVYAAFLAALAALDLLTPLDLTACQYATAATFTKNFGCGSWIDGHLWSLSAEEQFYTVWPLVVGLAPGRWRWPLAAALIAGAPAFRVWFYAAGWPTLRHQSFMTNADSLMIGCAAGFACRRHPAAAARLLSRAPVAGRLAAAGAIYAVWVLQLRHAAAILTVPLGPTIQAAAAAYLIASYAFCRQGIGYRILNARPVAYLGVLSYSVYIWQQPFFSDPDTFGAESAALLTFPVNVAATLAVAALSYHALERPLLRLRARLRPPLDHHRPGYVGDRSDRQPDLRVAGRLDGRDQIGL